MQFHCFFFFGSLLTGGYCLISISFFSLVPISLEFILGVINLSEYNSFSDKKLGLYVLCFLLCLPNMSNSDHENFFVSFPSCFNTKKLFNFSLLGKMRERKRRKYVENQK